jgi:hypothetical protein
MFTGNKQPGETDDPPGSPPQQDSLDLLSLENEEKDEERNTTNLSSPRKNRPKNKGRAVDISNQRLRTGDLVYFSFAQQPGEGDEEDNRDGEHQHLQTPWNELVPARNFFRSRGDATAAW